MRPTLEIARQYGVVDWHFGGCARGSPIHVDHPAAMRKSAHAHNSLGWPLSGHICFKAHSLDRVNKTLIWHEIAHIWRRSWSEAQCDSWARKMAHGHT